MPVDLSEENLSKWDTVIDNDDRIPFFFKITESGRNICRACVYIGERLMKSGLYQESDVVDIGNKFAKGRLGIHRQEPITRFVSGEIWEDAEKIADFFIETKKTP